MKRMLCSLFALCLLMSATTQAGVLFSDNYERASDLDVDASSDGMGGSLGALTYVEAFEGAGPTSNQVIDGVLQMATGNGMGSLFLDHNFTDDDILQAGGFTVSLEVFEIDNTAGGPMGRFGCFAIGLTREEAESGGDWGATTLGISNPANAGTTISDFVLGLSQDNILRVKNNDDIVAELDVGVAAGVLRADFQIASFAAGATVSYTIYFNGEEKPELNGSFVWDNDNANYIALVCRANNLVKLDNLEIKTEGESYTAGAPSPGNGSQIEQTVVNLAWSAGFAATSYDVFFGTDVDAVANASAGDAAFLLNTKETMIAAQPVAPGTTYYWRVDALNPSEPNSPWTGQVWSFSVKPETAYEPVPTNGMEYVLADTTLTWQAGLDALLHIVHFGSDPGQLVASPMQIDNSFTVSDLAPGTTYYWRVDEFRPAGTITGQVWSFTTMPEIASTGDSSLLGWWNFDEEAPGAVVDRSGNDLHGAISSQPEWIDGVVGGAVHLDGRDDYFTTSAPVDVNTNTVTMTGWVKVAKAHGVAGLIFSRGTGSPTSGMNLKGQNQLAYHWGAVAETYQFNSGLIVPMNEWTFVAVVIAPDKATLFMNGSDLWRENLIAHPEVAFTIPLTLGRDPQGTRYFSGGLDDLRFYTRALTGQEIDDVMAAGTVPPPPPTDPMVIESFDNYRSYFVESEPNVWDVWSDGYENFDNGSVAGNLDEPLMQRVNVIHNIGQSLPMGYDNSGATLSEISRSFSPAEDLTRNGATQLVVWLKGVNSNLALETDQVSLVLEDGSQTQVVVVADSKVLTKGSWTKATVALDTLTIDPTRLSGLGIRVSASDNVANGSNGLLYIDNISLE